MASPFLPGNSSNKQLGKERFHKSQHFDFSNGLPVAVGSAKPGIGGELLVGQKITPNYSVYPNQQGRGLPLWLVFDKQTLCFEAYFQEAVSEARDETYRIRKCKIYFYLEDDTVQVVEPECKNSGIPQGTIIRRQRIPLSPPNDDQFYNIFHFNINQQMVLYSRTFTLTNCDLFTRNFLTKLGVRLNDPTTVPDDPHSKLREQMEKSMNPLRPYKRHDTLKQFLDHDRDVLRFYCFWDNTEVMFGELREFVLYYFLADDTIEIQEVVPPNSGRDKVSRFLHRSKLPKTGAVHVESYKDCDLTVGGEVNVWGRRMVIADCDDFTKEYYRFRYGREDFTPVKYKAPPSPTPSREVPPYNGFGSEEDSLSFCQGLLPKPPQKDFHKFMEKDRCGLESNVLTFIAKMVTSDPVDRDRAFIISFYLCDDSISVFERPQRNSGVLGGKFLARSRVKKPGQELFKSQPSEHFIAQDLYVGASLCLNSVQFQLLDADEYTFKYMEQNAEEFPKANLGNILSKLCSISEEKQSEIRKFLALSDPSNTGFIPYESFRGLLMGLDCGLSEHEVLALGRSVSECEQPEEDLGLMLAVAQDFLKKKHFEEFSDLARAFTHQDQLKAGHLSAKETRTICKAFQLPLPEKLLGGLLNKFADGDNIDYHAFLAGINWREHSAPPVLPQDTLKFDVNVGLGAARATVKNVNYSSLLADVFSIPSSSGGPTAST